MPRGAIQARCCNLNVWSVLSKVRYWRYPTPAETKVAIAIATVAHTIGSQRALFLFWAGREFTSNCRASEETPNDQPYKADHER